MPGFQCDFDTLSAAASCWVCTLVCVVCALVHLGMARWTMQRVVRMCVRECVLVVVYMHARLFALQVGTARWSVRLGMVLVRAVAVCL